MKRYSTALLVLTACSSTNGDADPTSTVSLTSAGTGVVTLSAGTADDDGPGTEPGDASDDGVDDGPGTKFDLEQNGDICAMKEAGVYCDGTIAITCDGNGGATDTTNCLPGECVPGEGCVECLDGQFACHGPRVMACDTGGADPTWSEIEVCDPAAQMVCDSSVGMCVPLAPIGDIVPTGEYYQYAVYDLTSAGFSQISDVDSIDNRIYFVGMYNGGQLTVGVYDVELEDTDGDGQLEPNQHPDYPEEQGPIENRVFTFVEQFPIDNPGAFPNVMELYATNTELVYSGMIEVRSRDHATGTVTQVAPMPTWIGSTTYQWLAFLGYDEINDVWYSGNESARRVFQYDSESGTWGYAFEFPILAGDHMDGLEVVTDVTTGTPYVYVSDMTSNFIGQYRHDPEEGWVQHNLFSYVEVAGAPVEGFGFGALNHFWCGSLGQTFYELGGGDLTEYIDPEG